MDSLVWAPTGSTNGSGGWGASAGLMGGGEVRLGHVFPWLFSCLCLLTEDHSSRQAGFSMQFLSPGSGNLTLTLTH